MQIITQNERKIKYIFFKEEPMEFNLSIRGMGEVPIAAANFIHIPRCTSIHSCVFSTYTVENVCVTGRRYLSLDIFLDPFIFQPFLIISMLSQRTVILRGIKKNTSAGQSVCPVVITHRKLCYH